MKRLAILGSLLLFLSAILGTDSSYAQVGPEAKFIHVVTTPQADTLHLSILFTILDQNGYPIPKDSVKNIRDGKVQRLLGTTASVDAKIDEAATPLKIALIIDASGSMSKKMPDVKLAAMKFIDEVPGNVQIAIYRFSQERKRIQDFTSQKELLETAIKSIEPDQAGTGNTCLYDAAYQTIEEINDQTDVNPEERHSLVLFTDGKDRESKTLSCGSMQEQDVINEAILSERIPVQVNTIGLCADQSCSNIDVSALNDLSKKTYAYPAQGTLDKLEGAFNNILASLTGQWIAQADVLAVLGSNEAVLTFTADVNDQPQKLTVTNIEFNSEKNYVNPPKVELTQRGYNTVTNVYTLTLRVTSPEEIGEIDIDAADSAAGTIVSTATVRLKSPDIKSDMVVLQSADDFVTDRDYCSRVRATSKSGDPIKNDKGEDILASQCGKYEAQAEVKLILQIKSADVNWQSKTFDIRLDQVQGRTDNLLTYSGYINQGTRLAQDIAVTVLQKDQELIQVPLSDKELALMDQGRGQLDYTIHLALKEESSGRVSAPINYTAKPTARPTEGIFDFIGNALKQPTILGSIVAIVLILAALLIFLSFRARSQSIPLPAVHNASGNTIISNYKPPSGPSGSAQLNVDTPRTGMPKVNPISGSANQPQSSYGSNPKPSGAHLSGFAPLSPPSSNKKTQAEVIHRPQSGSTARSNAGANADATIMEPQLLVRIAVIETSDPSQIRGQIIRHFPCVMGRDPTADFIIDNDSSLSRKHAEIIVDDGKLMLKDLNSVNGTFLAGNRLPTGGTVPLDRLNKIKLGRNTTLKVEAQPDGAFQPRNNPPG